MQRVVISGGPASGKTSLINSLSEKGYSTFPEVARKVIKQQLNIGTNKVPWDDVTEFSKLVLKEQINDFKRASERISFFDRGIPDIIGYMNHGNEMLFSELKTASSYFQYNYVFMLPPWEDIYENDNERREDFKSSCLIFNEIEKAYKSLNYSTIIVPKTSILKRSEFILAHIND